MNLLASIHDVADACQIHPYIVVDLAAEIFGKHKDEIHVHALAAESAQWREEPATGHLYRAAQAITAEARRHNVAILLDRPSLS